MKIEQTVKIAEERKAELWSFSNETLCMIWYHLNNLKNAKNTHGGVLF